MITSTLLVWLFAGLSSGLLIGLCGAGGGIIAIPVLMFFGHMSLKQATGYSLVVVTIGATFAWLAQWRFTRYRLSVMIVFTSTIASYIVADYKHLLPNWFDVTLLWLVCIFGFYKVWTVTSDSLIQNKSRDTYTLNEYLLAAACGFLLGPLITIIGVGGGLVTVPWLLTVIRLPMKEAVATDIFSILLVAPFSAWAQGRFDMAIPNFIALTSGTVIAILAFTVLRFYISKQYLVIVRKGALTFAMGMAMFSSVAKSHEVLILQREYRKYDH